jgi:hypothetical protein
VLAGHPAFYSTSGTVLTVTGQEFLQTCAIPNSNGVDAYVFEVPKAYQKITSTVEAKGTTPNTVAGYDLDIFVYDKNCNTLGVYQATGTDEVGTAPKKSAFILVHPYSGNPVDTYITLKATK